MDCRYAYLQSIPTLSISRETAGREQVMSPPKTDEKLIQLSMELYETIAFADAERISARHACLTTGHLLLGVLHTDSFGAKVLRELGIQEQQARNLICAAIQYDELEKCTRGWSKALVRLLVSGEDESPKKLSLEQVLLRLANRSETIGGQILASFGVTAAALSHIFDARCPK